MQARKNHKAVRLRALNQRLLRLRRERPIVFNLVALVLAAVLFGLAQLLEWFIQ